ncbi:porin [Paraburkholderia sp. DGU8]|uniref:porin n=1 Tax=Paraburkholderia sp. DGU8 TaxID=3161997 RepID=UPI0034672A34
MGAATIWCLYSNTRFVPVTGTTTTFEAYDLGVKYAFTKSMIAGLGYTYMNASSNGMVNHWNQVNTSVDYSFSKTTDVYLLGIYQAASGHVGNRPLQAIIGSSQTAYLGASGPDANSQLAMRVGMRRKF